jgi:hypothetical protein
MVADSRIPQGEPPLPFLQAKQKRTRRENAQLRKHSPATAGKLSRAFNAQRSTFESIREKALDAIRDHPALSPFSLQSVRAFAARSLLHHETRKRNLANQDARGIDAIREILV